MPWPLKTIWFCSLRLRFENHINWLRRHLSWIGSSQKYHELRISIYTINNNTNNNGSNFSKMKFHQTFHFWLNHTQPVKVVLPSQQRPSQFIITLSRLANNTTVTNSGILHHEHPFTLCSIIIEEFSLHNETPISSKPTTQMIFHFTI